ncbi:MAG: hypothetical protein K5694_06870 [Bacilli bacterium]|nr:hypothetical protein [Bacilli bacterium]
MNEKNDRGNTAGTKLKNDILSFFKEAQFKPINKIPLVSGNKKGVFYVLRSIIGLIPVIWKLLFSKKRTIIMIYPLIKISFWKRAFYRACKRNTIILYVFDLLYYQYKCFNTHKDFTLEQECKFLNNSSVCILASEKEKKILNENGLTTDTKVLDFLDYKSDTYCEPINNRIRNSVAFAGYLKRSTFLKRLDNKDEILFFLFGDGFDSLNIHNSKITHVGSFDSESLVSKMKHYMFGLVWDGDDEKTLEYFYGGYEKIIIPHKSMAYINAGLPLIVWSKSAIADLVDKYNIGIKINSLNEINDAISLVDEIKYQKMVNNLLEIQKLLSSNYYLKRALNDLIT